MSAREKVCRTDTTMVAMVVETSKVSDMLQALVLVILVNAKMVADLECVVASGKELQTAKLMEIGSLIWTVKSKDVKSKEVIPMGEWRLHELEILMGKLKVTLCSILLEK